MGWALEKAPDSAQGSGLDLALVPGPVTEPAMALVPVPVTALAMALVMALVTGLVMVQASWPEGLR